MAVQDLWMGADRQRTARHGRGKRWRVSVPGHPTKAFAVKADAVEWERELWTRPAPGVIGPGVTVGDCVTAWLATKQGLSPRGIVACRGDAHHVTARWGSTPVHEVARHQVQAWIAGLTVQPHRSEEPRPASEALRRRLLQCLTGALDIAREHGIIDTNPCRGVTVPRRHKREARFLTVAELRQLAERTPERWRPLVWLLGTCGLRIGEAAALKVGDIDTARGRLRVARAKTGRGRDVPVPHAVLDMLPIADRQPRDPLFVGERGGPLDVNVWRARVWRPAIEALGWGGLRIHDLRHTAASLAIASGADVKAVQAMLGHASATMTLDLYGHLLDSRLDDVAAWMGVMLEA